MKKYVILAALTILIAPFLQAEESSPSSATSPKLKVTVLIGTGIKDKNVTGAADSFPATTTQLYGWSRTEGAKEPTQLMHVWKFNGKKVFEVPLIIETSFYRSYSRKSVAGKAGTWALEVQDIDGNVLGKKEVEVASK